MRETRVWALSWEESLEKEMASHSSITWKIPWTEEPGRLQSMGSQRVGHDWATSLHFTWDNSLCNMRHWKIKHTRRSCPESKLEKWFFFFFLPCPGVSWYLHCYLLQDDLVQSRSSFFPSEEDVCSITVSKAVLNTERKHELRHQRGQRSQWNQERPPQVDKVLEQVFHRILWRGSLHQNFW